MGTRAVRLQDGVNVGLDYNLRRGSKHAWYSVVAVLVVVLGLIGPATAACIIQGANGRLGLQDPLAKLLLTHDPCPGNVFEFRTRLQQDAGATIKTALVANRGFHNPKTDQRFMQFMLFETVSGRLDSLGITLQDGEFFFGHFTAIAGANILVADQQPSPNALMIELIAWDPVKQVFNFYELRGDGQKGQWFYRGDSVDIQDDVRFLHRQPHANAPQFGEKLRCSGCHIAGGPIMKELLSPHNDWSTTKRPLLPVDKLKPDALLSPILQDVVDADELAKSVKAGLLELQGSEKFQQAKRARSLQEQLRPLFCPVEVNLDSDPTPLEQQGPKIEIPSAFLVNPILAQGSIAVDRAHYDAALAALKASFPETALADADHGWLTPVKAFSDTLFIESLVKQGIIDQEFVIDVLAVDLTNPVTSPARCGLLGLLPATADGDWHATFKASLRASADPAAQELLKNLTDPRRNRQFHQERATRFLQAAQKRLQTKDAVIEMYTLLAQRRAEVFASEISQNRQGQIFEPGFRVIFPQVTPAAKPGSLRLTEEGQVIRHSQQ
jgi:hypothetical protein